MQKVSVGLEFGIRFGHGKEPAERKAEALFRLAHVPGAASGRLHARLPSTGNGGKHVLFMHGVALHRAHERRHEIVPALQLHVYAAPGLLGKIAAAHHGVVKRDEHRCKNGDDGDDDARCDHEHSLKGTSPKRDGVHFFVSKGQGRISKGTVFRIPSRSSRSSSR